VSLQLIDDLDLQIAALTVQLKRRGADHRYIPLLVTAPGIGWINGYTIASEIGDIARFSSPAKLCGYTGLCPRVRQSGAVDARGPISKHGPKYLRWALFEAALNACKHPYYAERYQHTKRRLGRQRGGRSNPRRRRAEQPQNRRSDAGLAWRPPRALRGMKTFPGRLDLRPRS
jgi:transposase